MILFFCRVVVLFSFSLRESNQVSSNQSGSQKNLPSFRRTNNCVRDLSKKSNKDLLEESRESERARERERERERKKDEKPSSFSSCSSSTASPSKVPFHPPRALRKSAISRVKKVKKRKANYSGKNFLFLCLGYQNGCFSPCFPVKK